MANGEAFGALVGIDIGMTSTGVAICAYSGGHTQGPIVIQNWPGYDGIENKVPTRIAYEAGGATYRSWGFGCPNPEGMGRAMAIKDMFKFHLEQWYHQQGPKDPFVFEDVKLWYKDFLSALYHYIVQFLRKNWDVNANLTTVEYIFSIPTSWRQNDQLIQMFRDLVDDAGFKSGSVVMNLTEAEASAVCTAKLAKERFQKGDAFIVCDAGGATTDMCALQVTEVNGDAVKLSLLDKPLGLPVGSLDIDTLFEEKAKSRIDKLREKYPDLSENLPRQITRKQFQDIKKQCGTPLVTKLTKPEFKILGIDEKIELSSSELEAMFDIQIKKMQKAIDHQLGYLKKDCPDVNVATLILAGGLGSSEYLQKEMTKYYKGIRVIFAPNPKDLFCGPLTVCKGLVYDRLQHFTDHGSVISVRSTNASYGILCSKRYSKKHTPAGQIIVRDRLDRKKYADNQIDWIIVQGEDSAKEETVIRKYSRLVRAEDPQETWGFAVVRSQAPPDELPTFFEARPEPGGPRYLCHVISDGDGGSSLAPLSYRRGRLGKKYIYSNIECEISATLGSGKLKFQMATGGRADGRHEPLRVVWDDAVVGYRRRDRCELIKKDEVMKKDRVI